MLIWFPKWNWLKRLLFDIRKEKRAYANSNRFENFGKEELLLMDYSEEPLRTIRNFYKYQKDYICMRISIKKY